MTPAERLLRAKLRRARAELRDERQARKTLAGIAVRQHTIYLDRAKTVERVACLAEVIRILRVAGVDDPELLQAIGGVRSRVDTAAERG